MHNFIRTTALVAVLAGMAAPATAATPGEFYMNLLRRGVASYEATRYPEAAKQLRIAAFGLIESIDQYQLAQMYLALTWDKLGDQARAREAAHRVVVAERVQRRYASVTASPAVRNAFESVAVRVLSPAELATLRGGTVAAPPPATARTTTTAPRTTTPPQTATTPPQTAPQPPAPQPASPAVVTPAPQTQTITPMVTAPAKPTPEPVAAKPVSKPATAPAGTETTAGRGGPVEPARPVAPAPRPLSATEIRTRLTAADRALNAANLVEARRVYRELLAAPGLDHASLIRLAEGLYRARDFASALNAFNRIDALRRGEEPYRYYIAVAAYETGDYARAKRELAAALPFIEITPDVARYRSRIEGAQ